MSAHTPLGRSHTLFALLSPLLSLLLVWLLSQTLLYQRIDNWVSDQQQYRVAEEIYFDDVIFVDIDDDSIHNLQPDFGVWPYDRDIYGMVLDYLSRMGAKTIVFDILFLESRKGDRVFADAVQRHTNTVFAVSAPIYRAEVPSDQHEYRRLLDGLSWSVPHTLPVTPVDRILLPVTDLIHPGPAARNIGIVDVSADADGLVRRIPYVYQVGDSYIPSLPLVAQQLHRKEKKIRSDQKRIRVGGDSWPVDDRGLLNIYFPRNSNSLLSLSFHKVVRAAQGVFKPEGAEDFIRGKTVFIGSTAFKSDKVNTPRGVMSGTYLLAIIHQNLNHGLVLKPHSLLWDSLWVGLALIVLSAHILYRGYSPWKYGVSSILFLGVLVYLNGVLFARHHQPSVLLIPLLTVLTGYILYVLFFGFLIKKQNILLLSQKDELQLVNEALETEANTDTLTGMLNRRAYLSLFEHEIKRYAQTGVGFFVGIMDLDYFKKVNDTYGHEIGDDVLKNFAAVLQKSKRELDVVARWGGEEFVIFLPETGEAEALNALNKIRVAISEYETATPQGVLQVTVSIGVAEFNDLAMSPEGCISKADKALYEAKETGRNRVSVYHE